MKKLLLLCLVSFLSNVLPTNAQWQSTHGPHANGSFAKIIDGKIYTNLYYSLDTGLSFIKYPPSIGFNDVVKHQGTYFAAGNGLYNSADGISWNQIPAPEGSRLYSDGPNLYLHQWGVRRSADNGLSWQTIYDTTKYAHRFFVFGDKYVVCDHYGIRTSVIGSNTWILRRPGYFHDVIAMGSSLLFEEGNQFYLLDTATWTAAAAMNGMPGSVNIEARSFGASGTMIYAATASGIYYSDQNLINWQLLSPEIVKHQLSVEAPLMSATGHTGARISKDMGSSFQLCNEGQSSWYTVDDCAADGNLVYATSGGRLFKKPYWNNQWEQVEVPHESIEKITVMGDTLSTIIWNNIYFSYDAGNSWLIKSAGVGSDAREKVVRHKNSLFVLANDGIYRSAHAPVYWWRLWDAPVHFFSTLAANDSLLIASYGGKVYASADEGETWSTLISKSYNAEVAISNNMIALTIRDSVHYSLDFSTWTSVYNPHCESTNAIAISDSLILLQGHNYGPYGSELNTPLYALSTNTNTFQPFFNGLTDSTVWDQSARVTALTVHNSNIYCGMKYGGLYEIVGEEIPTSIAAEKNVRDFRLFPNPASSAARCIAAETVTEAELYDLRGVCLQRLQPRSCEFDINLDQFPPGVYFLRIKTKTGTGVKRIVKL